MAQRLAPGVYIEEISSAPEVTEGVSTSATGIVGFTTRGPEDQATRITSFAQYQRIFGAFSPNSINTDSVLAYFNNGGRVLYVVRVTPADATKGEAFILASRVNDDVAAPSGTTTVSATSGNTGFDVNAGDTPIQPESVTFSWRSQQPVNVTQAALALTTPYLVEDQTTRNREDDANLATALNILHYDGRIDPDSIPGVVPGQFVVDPSVGVTITWTAASGPLTIVIPAPTTGTTQTATNAGGSSAVLDFETGFFSLRIAPTETPIVGVVQASFWPTFGDTGRAFANIGTGANGQVLILAEDAGVDANGIQVVVDNDTGADRPLSVSFSANVLTILLEVVAAALTSTAEDVQQAVDALPDFRAYYSGTGATVMLNAETVSMDGGRADAPNVWQAVDTFNTITTGDVVSGDGFAVATPGTITYGTGAFSFVAQWFAAPHDDLDIKADYQIRAWALEAKSNGAWSDDMRLLFAGSAESLEPTTGEFTKYDLTIQIFNSTTLSFETIETLPELSLTDTADTRYLPDFVNPLSNLLEVLEPFTTEGIPQLQATPYAQVLGGGDQLNQVYTGTLAKTRVRRRSISITYQDASGNTRTITDDGAGNLTGNIDTVGVNTINYTTGEITVTTEFGVRSNTLLTVNYRQDPVETQHLEQFGDDDKFYTSGIDGTFNAANYGRLQMTDPALSATNGGVYALNSVDQLMLVIVPDLAGEAQATKDLLDYVDSRIARPSGGDRFVILAVPEGQTADDAVAWLQFQVQQYTKYAALYAPWVVVPDPLDAAKSKTLPPLGHVAGIYARTDTARNVSKAPAGTVDGALRGVTRLETNFTDTDREILNQARINALALIPPTNVQAVFGARTLSSLTEWRYIQAVRLFMFIEKSVFNSTQWVVFENNGPALWSRIKTQLDAFLGFLFTQGYFAGASPGEAFRVIVDESINPPESVALGNVFTQVFIAPTRPAEFVTFQFAQKINS